jgi:hypothetical protein
MCHLHRRWDNDLHIGYLGCCRKELCNLEISSDVWRYLPRIPAHHNSQQAHTCPQRKEGTGETVNKRPQQRPNARSHIGTGPDMHCVDHCYVNIKKMHVFIVEKREEQAVYEFP